MAKHCPECGTPLTKDQMRRRGTYCSRKCSGRSNKREDLKRSRTNKGHAKSSYKKRRPSTRKGSIKVVEQPPRTDDTHPLNPPPILATASQVEDLSIIIRSQNKLLTEVISLVEQMSSTLTKIDSDVSHLILYQEVMSTS